LHQNNIRRVIVDEEDIEQSLHLSLEIRLSLSIAALLAETLKPAYRAYRPPATGR
jgi:hypothetical protein